jgi:hypothetical protein
MPFDRSPESYAQRALWADRQAEQCTRDGEREWARIWREIATDMRAKAVRLSTGRPAAEMAVVG